MDLSHSCGLRLATQLDCLAGVLGDAGEAALRRRPPDGRWSALENLAHLARHHEIMLERLRRIVSEEAPTLARYRAEDDPEWASWGQLSTEEVLGRLLQRRKQLIGAVDHLTPAELGRVGIHPVLGPFSIPQWIEFFLLHEAHHFYTVMLRVRGA